MSQAGAQLAQISSYFGTCQKSHSTPQHIIYKLGSTLANHKRMAFKGNDMQLGVFTMAFKGTTWKRTGRHFEFPNLNTAYHYNRKAGSGVTYLHQYHGGKLEQRLHKQKREG